MAAIKQRITNCLWFDRQAEEAANFYVSIFPNSRIGRIARYGKEGFEAHHMPAGTVMTVEFVLDGQEFLAMNGGPAFKFNMAISLMVACESQKEIDYYWEKLTNGGREDSCGWLQDKYGLSWQVVPDALADMMADPERAGRVMEAFLQMKKFDLKKLQEAYEKEPA